MYHSRCKRGEEVTSVSLTRIGVEGDFGRKSPPRVETQRGNTTNRCPVRTTAGSISAASIYIFSRIVFSSLWGRRDFPQERRRGGDGARRENNGANRWIRETMRPAAFTALNAYVAIQHAHETKRLLRPRIRLML